MDLDAMKMTLDLAKNKWYLVPNIMNLKNLFHDITSKFWNETNYQNGWQYLLLHDFFHWLITEKTMPEYNRDQGAICLLSFEKNNKNNKKMKILKIKI